MLQMVVMNGTTAAFDFLSHALFDPGEFFITPTPTYGRTFTNFNNRSLAIPVGLSLPYQVKC